MPNLITTRKAGQSLDFDIGGGETIRVTLVRIGENRVTIATQAPESVAISRPEANVKSPIERENAMLDAPPPIRAAAQRERSVTAATSAKLVENYNGPAVNRSFDALAKYDTLAKRGDYEAARKALEEML